MISIFHLSGGEKQKIACASISVMNPDILVLDEPSSNLDSSSIQDLRDILSFWKAQGKTIIISEHRLYYLKGLADRFIYLDQGTIQKEFSAQEFDTLTDEKRNYMGLRTYDLPTMPCSPDTAGSPGKITIQNFYFSYRDQIPRLQIDHSHLYENSITAIIGNNGAGKSTFARCLCGLEKKQA